MNVKEFYLVLYSKALGGLLHSSLDIKVSLWHLGECLYYANDSIFSVITLSRRPFLCLISHPFLSIFYTKDVLLTNCHQSALKLFIFLSICSQFLVTCYVTYQHDPADKMISKWFYLLLCSIAFSSLLLSSLGKVLHV